MTRISVHSNFAPIKRKIDSVLLDEETSNLISGLAAVEAATKIKLVDADLGEVYPDITVTVNGVDSNFLPEMLATKLSDGDILGISFITLGGG